MKYLVLFVLTLSAALPSVGNVPAFLKVGSVYVFAVSGAGSEKLIASVVKDEGSGWIRVVTVEKKEEIWINLAQVHAIVPIEGNADTLRAAMQRTQILTNLRHIAAAVDQYRLSEGKEPTSIGDVMGAGKLLRPITSVAGEDYRALEVRGDSPLKVRTREGVEIVYPRK